MFIIIPFIIVFLLYAYLVFNDLSLFGEIIIYSLMFNVIVISYLIAKKLKKDFKQQQINSIKRDIYFLSQKIENSDEKLQEHYKKELKLLQKDLEGLEE